MADDGPVLYQGQCAHCGEVSRPQPTLEQYERLMVAHFAVAHPEHLAGLRDAILRGPVVWPRPA